MATRRLPVLRPLEVVVVAGTLVVAFAAGTQVAEGAPKTVGILVALCFVPIVLLDLPLGIAVWLPLTFMTAVPGFFGAERVASLLLALAWIGTSAGRQGTRSAVARNHRFLFALVVGFSLWLLMSAAWADRPDLVIEDLQRVYPPVILFTIIATTLATPRDVKIAVAGYVLGAVTSVTIGLTDNSLPSNGVPSSLLLATDREPRLTGAEGDPNLLAAGLVPAVALACGLLTVSRSRIWRILLPALAAVVAGGLVATESRGGLIAAVLALVVAIVVLRRRRIATVAIAILLVGAGSVVLATSPTAYERITAADSVEGSGRVELWRVAARMSQDHPLLGVGLNNFLVDSKRYATEVGALEFGEFLTETPLVVHNVYLQLLAETGPVGLALFVAIVATCLRAFFLAARRFEHAGEDGMAVLARAVLAGTVGMLAASFFLSNAHDPRLWVLLALGPAMLSVATGVRDRRRLDPGPAPPLYEAPAGTR